MYNFWNKSRIVGSGCILFVVGSIYSFTKKHTFLGRKGYSFPWMEPNTYVGFRSTHEGGVPKFYTYRFVTDVKYQHQRDFLISQCIGRNIVNESRGTTVAVVDDNSNYHYIPIENGLIENELSSFNSFVFLDSQFIKIEAEHNNKSIKVSHHSVF